MNKGRVTINGNEFDGVNFIHHLVYISISLVLNKRHYSINEVKNLNLDTIDENLINQDYNIIIDAIVSNEVMQSKILKTIKEQIFNNYINEKLDLHFHDYCHKILPALPSFLPLNDKECTNSCQPVYHYLRYN